MYYNINIKQLYINYTFMNANFIKTKTTAQSLISAVLVLPLVLGIFFAFEPTVAKSQGTTREFTIQQTIDGEISFIGAVNNVTMSPNIPGLTGGTANGSTTFAVSTNNSLGYQVTIEFENPTEAMRFGDGSGTGFIPNFGTIERLFAPNVAANSAAFGFTIAGPNVDQLFLDSGSACNSPGGASTTDTCWYLGDTTAGFTIVDSTDTALEEEHTLFFRVHVNSNPSPTLSLGTYTATATLTAVDK